MKKSFLMVSKQLVVLLVLCLLIPPVTLAQDINGNWMVLQTISSGQPVLVKTASGRSLKGHFQRVDDSALELSVNRKAVALQSGEISRVYILRGRPILKDSLIGISVGGGAGAIFGAAIGDSSRNGFGPYFSKGACAAVFAGVGIVVGGLIGLAVGSSKHKKELVYKAARAH